MGKIGKYKEIKIYDYRSRAGAWLDSKLGSFFTVYWVSEDNGVMLWRGNKVADIVCDFGGIHVLNFDEKVFYPKVKPRHEEIACDLK